MRNITMYYVEQDYGAKQQHLPNSGIPVRHNRKVRCSSGCVHTFLQSAFFVQGRPEGGNL